MPVSVFVRISRPTPCRNFRTASGRGEFAEGIAAARLDGFQPRFDEGMIRHGKRQARDDDIAQRVARHIHALPEAVRAEQHRIGVALELIEHDAARRAGALDVTFHAGPVEVW
jgi:hypothetical protein